MITTSAGAATNSVKVPSILIAEDDDNDVFFLERAFKQAQVSNPRFRVRDGEEAIAYLQGDGEFSEREKFPLPHLLLLDLKMPRKNGFEVIAWVRSRPGFRRLIIVVLSSSKEDPDINRAYDMGVNSYLVKPARFEALMEMVRALNQHWLVLAERPSLEE